MVVLPSDSAKPVTNSRAMWDQRQLGVRIGWSRPDVSALAALLEAQMGQVEMNSFTLWSIVGHKKHCCKTNRVLFTPGWQLKGEEWPHWITVDWCCWEMKNELEDKQQELTDLHWLLWLSPRSPIVRLPTCRTEEGWRLVPPERVQDRGHEREHLVWRSCVLGGRRGESWFYWKIMSVGLKRI